MRFSPNLSRRTVAVVAIAAFALIATAPSKSDAAGNHPEVSVVGLGRMGSALAKAFLDNGYKVTVWNRTASKAKSLVTAGALLASSPSAAISASPLTIVSLSNKTVVKSILSGPGVSDAMSGHTIVDLSSGSPADARMASHYVLAKGARYLDGAILAYPREIGTKDAVILYAGSAATFRANEKTLAALAHDERFLGEDPGAAATGNLALLDYFFVAINAYLEGAALAQTSGITVDEFRSLAGVMTRKIPASLDDASRRISMRDYSGDQAPINEYGEAFEMIRQALADRGLKHQVADAFISYASSAQKANDGDKDIAVLFRTIGGRD